MSRSRRRELPQLEIDLGYFVRPVSWSDRGLVAIYDPQGRFVCLTSADDAPVAILIDQAAALQNARRDTRPDMRR